MVYSIIEDVDSAGILTRYFKLASGICWYENSKSKQAGLQYAEGEDPFLSCIGRLKEGRSDQDYSILNPFFKDTVFEELIVKYKMFRTRLMWVNDKSCYSLHKDGTKRLHIPLVTNEQCMFIFPEVPEVFHLESGKAYMVDTTMQHSFANFSDKPRLHLVGCVL